MVFGEQILLCLGLLVITGLLIKWMRKKDSSKIRHPPSLPSLPLVGSLPFIRNFDDIPSFMKQKAEELGPIFMLRVFNSPMLMLNSIDVIEKAFIKNGSSFSDRAEFFLNTLINPDNRGITFKTSVKEWKKTQQVTLSILKDFGFGVKSMMEERIMEEVEAMTEYVMKKKGKAFDPKEMCILATSNIMLNICFGHRHNYDLGLCQMFEELHKYIFNLSNVFDLVPFLKYIPAFRKQMKDITDATVGMLRCIDEEIAKSSQKNARSCFAKSYIEKVGADMEHNDFRYIMRDLMAAGADTTSTTLQWCFLILANNPDVQKRLQAEIDAVIPGDRLPTLQDEANLPYTRATILEMTRWRTLVPLSVPRATSRDCDVDGYHIPGQTMVFANLYAAHFDPKVWKDPEVFRPERFLDSENNVVGQERILPFSIGKRSCLGEALALAEMFLIFTSFVKRFQILPEEGQSKIADDPVLPILIVIYPKPYKIRMIQRKSN